MSERSIGGLRFLPLDGAALGVAVLASALAAAIVVFPSWRMKTEQASLLDRRAEAQRRLQLANSELERAQGKLSEVAQQVEPNGLRTLPVSSLNSRLAELVDLAGKSGMKLDVLSPGEKIRTKRTVSVQITMSGTCPVDAFQGFLQQLRAQCPDIAVTALLLNRQKVDGGQGPTGIAASGAKFSIDLVWHAAPDVPISANRNPGP
ncbi:MAG: hypothetical protein NTV94_13655 [Planctomycetota bacterium]|nr:hypothetical protein [Planctomycetota bacterium]